MKNQQVIYICGPISRGGGPLDTQAIDECQTLYNEVALLGGCPVGQHAYAEGLDTMISWEDAVSQDLRIIERVDALYLHPAWKTSRGCCVEVAHARSMDIPCLETNQELAEYLEDPPVRTKFVRSFDLIDEDMVDFLHEKFFPKYQLGSLEHGNATWKDLTLGQIVNSYATEEYMDISAYMLIAALKMEAPGVDDF